MVTRRPPRNSLVDAEPVEHRRDLRAAAVDDDRAQAGVAQEDDVLRRRRALSSSSTMALPPYLTTTIAPRNRSSHGSASTSVCALAEAAVRDVSVAPVAKAGHVLYAEFSWT